MYVNRPKPSDDVEILEQQQQLFFASREKTSVTVKRGNSSSNQSCDDEASKEIVKKKSRFKTERDQGREKVPSVFNSTDIVTQDLVERPGTAIYVPQPPQPGTSERPFPTVTRRDISISPEKGRCIFMKCMSARQEEPQASQTIPTQELIDMEHASIEQENLARLHSMSEPEILSAQSELLRKLDPNLVKFIKERKAKPKQKVHQILKGGSQIDDAALRGLLSPQNQPQQSPSIAEFVEDELPFMPSEMAKFPHMNLVEKEKLAWMTLLPKPDESKYGKNFSCRFDLEGRILPPDADIPTQNALHHHGEEPERAGYTIEELLGFLSSMIQSQRILALQHHLGKYDLCFPKGPNVMECLIEAGFVIVLRVALDSHSASQMSEALKTLQSFICNRQDEMCLDLISDWTDEEPYLRPKVKIMQPKQQENSSQLRDEELVAIDVVEGLLRMDLLPRIRYLLEVCKPDVSGVVVSLEVLTRIARQSPEAADEISRCPRLCSFIVKEYLPLYGWREPQSTSDMPQGPMASGGGVPLAAAMKLVRVLCQSSNSVCAQLSVEHNLERLVGVFLSRDPTEGTLAQKEILQLQLEALRLLRVLLRHNLSQDLFDDLSPIIVRQMQYAKQITALSKVKDSQLFDLTYASCLMQCVHARLGTIVRDDSGDWHAISQPMIEAAACACHRWLRNLVEDKLRLTSMGSLSVVLRLLADLRFHNKSIDMSPVVSALLSIPQSKWTELWLALKSDSMLLKLNGHFADKRDPESLTSLGSIEFGTERAIPLVSESNPVFLLSSILYFIWTTSLCDIADSHKLAIRMLTDKGVKAYLSAIISEECDSTTSWFARTEVSLLYRAIRLCGVLISSKNRFSQYPSNMPDIELYRECAIKILPSLGPDRAVSVNHILSQVIFDQKFYSEVSTIGFSSLEIGEPVDVRSSTGHLTKKSRMAMIENLHNELPSLLQSVSELVDFILSSIPAKFLATSQSKSSQCEFLFSGGLLPKDWMYLPVRILFNESSNRTQQKPKSPGEQPEGDSDRALNLELTLKCLKNVSLLSVTSNVVLRLPPLVNFIRLASVFLIDCDTFLDPTVNEVLAILFSRLIVPKAQNCNFEQPSFQWDSLPSFSDFYAMLLDQYDACSYGDAVFSAFLLCPQQMCYHADFRKILFIEHASLLRNIVMDEDGLLGIPLTNFLEPKETDNDLIVAHKSALHSQLVLPQRNPLIYKILSGHIS